jgi:hypothetical protein
MVATKRLGRVTGRVEASGQTSTFGMPPQSCGGQALAPTLPSVGREPTERTRLHRKRWLGIARKTFCPAIAAVMTTPQPLCREENAMAAAA